MKKKTAQTQVRKGRLSRMMAVREDSDENSIGDDEDDPFVKSTEVQTDESDHNRMPHSATASSESLTEKDQLPNGAKLEDGIQEYLVKVMNNIKLAMKAYVIEQQQDIQNRIIQLESDVRKKEEVIKHLKLQLKRQRFPKTSSTFDEVSSIDPSSLSVSDMDENDSECINVEHDPGEEDRDDDEDKDLDDEEIRILQEKLKTQRKSWPTSIAIGRRKIRSSNKSYSLDEEQQLVEEEPNSDELWRLEFPPPPADMPEKVSSSTASKVIATIPERLIEESSLPESEEEDQISDKLLNESRQPNDWEVQMLVQQFERNVRQQRRRHSSGEALTWDKVLHLRKVAMVGDQGPESGRSNRHSRRKYSLVEEGNLQRWATPSMVQSSSHTSLAEARGPHRTGCRSPVRRKSYAHQQKKHVEPPRKNSMPSLPPRSSIGMSRWLSMDDAKSEEGCRSQDSATLSSAYSQETVIGVESRFSSVDDLRAERTTSSADFEYSAAPGSHLPEWPSSPCLPTISEDEQSFQASGRSASLSTLLLPASESGAGRRTTPSGQRRASADFGSTPDNLCLGNNARAFNKTVILPSSRGVSNNNVVDATSVVIAIPEYEPLLSP